MSLQARRHPLGWRPVCPVGDQTDQLSPHGVPSLTEAAWGTLFRPGMPGRDRIDLHSPRSPPHRPINSGGGGEMEGGLCPSPLLPYAPPSEGEGAGEGNIPTSSHQNIHTTGPASLNPETFRSAGNTARPGLTTHRLLFQLVNGHCKVFILPLISRSLILRAVLLIIRAIRRQSR